MVAQNFLKIPPRNNLTSAVNTDIVVNPADTNDFPVSAAPGIEPPPSSSSKRGILFVFKTTIKHPSPVLRNAGGNTDIVNVLKASVSAIQNSGVRISTFNVVEDIRPIRRISETMDI